MRVQREHDAGAGGGDQHAAERRPGHPEDERAHELVQRVGLREPLAGARCPARARRTPGRRTPAPVPYRAARTATCQTSSVPAEREPGQRRAATARSEIRANHHAGAGRSGRSPRRR